MTKTSEDVEKALYQNHEFDALFNPPVAEVFEGRWPIALGVMNMHPSASELPSHYPQDFSSRHLEVVEAATREQIDIRFLGYSAVFSGTKLFQGDDSDWALMNLSEDPLFYSNNNKLLVPANVERDIKRIHDAGINFDAIFIAHELPSGKVQPDERIPLSVIAPPPPPEVMGRVGKRAREVDSFWSGVSSTLRRVRNSTTGALSFAAALTMRDPVLFGVLIDNSWQTAGQPVGMWYYLTHWYWPSIED